MDGPKRQQRIEATRSHLLAAARQVFAEKGYQGGSVAVITEAAGFSHGTFYLYFRNREDVFAEVMAEMLDELYRHSFTPFDQLGDRFDADRNRERIAAFLQVFAGDGRLWRALLEAVLASPVVEAKWLEHRTRFHEGLADRIRRFQASGNLPPYDADEVAVAMGGMIEWYAFTGVAFGAPRPLEASDHVVDSLSALWARALGAPGDAGDESPVAPIAADTGATSLHGFVGGAPSA